MKKKMSVRNRHQPSADLSLEQMAMRRLRELLKPLDRPSKLIRFPVVFGRICPVLCLTKREAWRLLHQLDESGHIDLVPYQGVKLLPPHPTPDTDVPNGEASQQVPREVTIVRKDVLAYLKGVGEAYPSDIAVALDLDIDDVFEAARALLKQGRIEV